MVATWFILLVGLVLLGAIALVAVLLAYSRTRPAGFALLSLFAGLAVLGVMLTLFVPFQSGDRSSATVTVSAEAPVTARLPSVTDTTTSPSGSGTAISPATTEQTTGQSRLPVEAKKAVGVLPAVTNSLVKAASETSVAQATRKMKETPSILAASWRALGKALARESKKPRTGVSEVHLRPRWVDAEPGVVDGAYQTSVMVGPFATQQECDEAQPAAVQEVADDYIQRYLETGPGSSVRLSSDYLQQHVVAETWEDERMTDFGPDIGSKPMIRRYVLLRFDREVNDELKRQLHRAMVHRRLRATAYGLAGVLALLALTFGYLKINLATGGRHRTGLRATAVAILVAAAAGVVLMS